MLADQTDFVIGGDTHRDRHTLAVVSEPAAGWWPASRSAPTGAAIGRPCASPSSMPRAAASGPSKAPAATAPDSHYLQRRGEQVVEIDRPARRGRRSRPKDDQLDAIAAARTALGRGTLPTPRSAQSARALQALLRTRDGAVRRARRPSTSSVLVGAPDELRAQLRGLTSRPAAGACRSLRRARPARRPLRRRARPARPGPPRHQLTAEARELERELARLVPPPAGSCSQARRGPHQRRPVAGGLVAPRPHPPRSRLRPLAGAAPTRPPAARPPPPPQPRRRPPTQPRPAHHRPHPQPRPPRHRGLHSNAAKPKAKLGPETTRCLKRYPARQLWRLLEHTPPAT